MRENSLIYAREILTSTREKKSFCARENVRVPEKICAKVGEKNKFPPGKSKKTRENSFIYEREILTSTREKKIILCPRKRSSARENLCKSGREK